MLNTTTTTVRSLIDKGHIDGYWVGGKARFSYFAYQTAIDSFIRLNGTFPQARRRHARPFSSKSAQPLDSETAARVDSLARTVAQIQNTFTDQTARVLILEEAVRRLSSSNAHLRASVMYEQEAARHLRNADEAHSKAAEALNRAGEQEAHIVSSLGIPDFPP